MFWILFHDNASFRRLGRGSLDGKGKMKVGGSSSTSCRRFSLDAGTFLSHASLYLHLGMAMLLEGGGYSNPAVE
jgi:hypothetical protein